MSISMKIFFRRKPRVLKAFSMPEVILSVFILSVGLMTIVAVMAGSLRYTMVSRDEIIATGLAQEGVELVRNNRDNDLTVAGHNGFTRFSTSNRHCRIDWNDNITANLDCANSKTLANYLLTYSSGMYSHGGAGAGNGKYYRYVYVRFRETAGADRATVRSFVFWANKTTNPQSTLNGFGNNGNASGCNLAHACVFSETFLTAWK